MERLCYRSIFDELNETRNPINSRFRLAAYDTCPTALLPATTSDTASKILPVGRTALQVDATENDHEVTVTADVIPGVSNEDIPLNLLNPRALEISCECKEEKKEEHEGDCLHEHTFGSMTRVVPLPRPVTEDGSRGYLKKTASLECT